MPAQSLAEVDFSVLPEAIVNAINYPTETSADDLAEILETHLDELHKVLETRPKNDASRQKIKGGTVELDEQEYKLNEFFIAETIKLSDDLDIDELDAASLLLKGQDLADRLDRSAPQGAIFIFHRSRLFLLQSLQLLFAGSIDDNSDSGAREVLQQAVTILTDNPSTSREAYFLKCTQAMLTIRKFVQKLREKEMHSISLGHHLQAGWDEWVEDLHVQLRFLTDQHEALSTVIYCLAKLGKVGISDFNALLEVMKSFEEYNILVAHHIPGLYATINKLCSHDSGLTFSEVISCHKGLLQSQKNTRWPLRHIQASVFLWWLTEFNGLCNDPPQESASAITDANNSLDYLKDIYQPARQALFEGALEYMLAVAADVGLANDLDLNRDNLREFLQNRAKQLTDSNLLSEDFKVLVIEQFEMFIDSFIANMADILKDLKIKEEEDVLLKRKGAALDLERFFFIISYTYYGRPDAALTFWNDPESNLFGFLMWASSSLTPLMATVMSYMVASFSFGEQCSEHAHNFLREDFPPGTVRQRRTNYLSWGSIFQALDNYITTLNSQRPQTAQTNMYRAPLPPMDTTEPALETTLVVDSYIRLIGRVAHESDVARTWLYEESNSFRVMEALFGLLDGRAPSQLLASIFTAVAAFLARRQEAYATSIWNAIDSWAFQTRVPSNTLQITAGPNVPVSSSAPNLESIVHSIYPAEAFIQLLVALVSPSSDYGSLNDGLPFPESLGSSTRLSGINPYVDFVMKDIFRGTLWSVFSKPKEGANPNGMHVATNSLMAIGNGARPQGNVTVPSPNDPKNKLRAIIQLSCLRFVMACLTSFNEDLILFSQQSGVSVDTAIQSSSLVTYAKLHPFARVMEHILSEKGIAVIFEIIKHGVMTLEKAPFGSPIVQTCQLSIEILEQVHQLQNTYVNIVRPLIKEEEGIRRAGPTLAGFSTLEDAVLYHLDVVVHLGLFVELGENDIAEAALRLLERLAVSPRLVQAPEMNFGTQVKRNRILNVVENHTDSRKVQFAFMHRMEAPNDDDFANGIKLRILKLLNASLEANQNEPSLAHFLLGFGIVEGKVDLATEQGGIGSGVSLFHSILDIVNDWNEKSGSTGEYRSTQSELKDACYSVLRRLWKSSLTNSDIMYVLRANKFLFAQFAQESPISVNTPWDGTPYKSHEEFFGSSSVDTFGSFLRRRSALFEYIALEIRQLTRQGATTMVSRYLSTLVGVTASQQGENVNNVHILDLLDFLELEPPSNINIPTIHYFEGVDFTPCQQEVGGVVTYDPESVLLLLELRRKELEKQVRIAPAQEDVIHELESIVEHAVVDSKLKLFKLARLGCLKAWAQLVIVVLENCEFEPAKLTAFMLQTLQTILPKLEQYSSADINGAMELSSLAHFLITHVKFDTTTFGRGRASDVANDRIYQLFKVSLRCLQSPMSHAKIREDFYSIAYRYLKGMTDLRKASPDAMISRHNIQNLKANGDRLLEVICNDAYVGEQACRIMALLLLDEFVAMGIEEKNKYVVEALVRQNFLVVMVDSIRRIRHELQDPDGAGFAMAFFKANTGFLLRVAQTRPGATHVLNAGLFQALTDSKLFEIDPDMGVGFNDPESLSRFYELVLSVVRLVTCCIISRGPQNTQSINQGRSFLHENRNVILNVFKKHMHIGGDKPRNTGEELNELTQMFLLLMTATEFVEAELENDPYGN